MDAGPAKRYDLKYTGVMIETYGAQVHGPFHELPGRAARDNVIIYGRELLQAGGELGLHGYNHQSLAPAGYGEDVHGYVPWESEQDMIEATQELYRYAKSLYPGYEFRVYVPPSNVLSPEGKDAVKQAVPTLKIIASLYDGPPSEKAYYQNYKRNDDGSYELPRISAGFRQHHALVGRQPHQPPRRLRAFRPSRRDVLQGKQGQVVGGYAGGPHELPR